MPGWWSILGQTETEEKLIRLFLYLKDSTGDRNYRKGVRKLAERKLVRFDA